MPPAESETRNFRTQEQDAPGVPVRMPAGERWDQAGKPSTGLKVYGGTPPEGATRAARFVVYGTPTVAVGRMTGEVMERGGFVEVGQEMITLDAMITAVHPEGMGIVKVNVGDDVTV